jgi:hypothetical protein
MPNSSSTGKANMTPDQMVPQIWYAGMGYAAERGSETYVFTL